MKEIYKVYVTETLRRECEIEAASEEEALQLLEEKYNENEIVLDYSDLADTEFSNCDGIEVLVKASDKLEAIDKARSIFIANKIEFKSLYCEEV